MGEGRDSRKNARISITRENDFRPGVIMLEPNMAPLFYLCAAAGLIMVIGSLWLIYTQKIFVDGESKQVTEIQTPFGSFKTNLPAILLFVVGFFFLGFPVLKASELTRDVRRTTEITGSVDSDEQPVIAYAVIAEQTMFGDKRFRLTVPIPSKGLPGYAVVVRAGPMFDRHAVDMSTKDGAGVTDPFHFVKAPASGVGESASDFEPDTLAVPDMFKK